MGDGIQADEYCGIAIEIEAARVAGQDTYTAVLMTLRGRIWFNQKRYAEAEKLLRKSLAIQSAILPEKNWERAKTASLLGAALAGLGRFEEGEPLVLNSYPIIRDNRKIGHRRTAEALDRIVFLYEQWGKHEKAEQWRKKKYVPRQEQMDGETLARPEWDVP